MGKDNRALSDEVKELSDQLSTGGKSIHEISKAKKKAEADAEDMRAALDEAEGALELESSRVLRLQLEMSQFKAELDRKLSEKDEEFDSTRKNHSRALESMQATLDAEVKARSDAARAKKKLDEASKNAKKYQALAKEAQDAADSATVAASELKDQAITAERKAQMMQTDYDDMSAALQSNERARKAAESDLYGVSDQLSALTSANSALTAQKRKLENELDAVKGDAEEAAEAVRSAEAVAKKAAAEAQKA